MFVSDAMAVDTDKETAMQLIPDIARKPNLFGEQTMRTCHKKTAEQKWLQTFWVIAHQAEMLT